MIREKLTEMIQSAAKGGKQVDLRVLRSILNEFVKREKLGKELTDKDEVKIIAKMADQRKESLRIYQENNRLDLAEAEKEELDFLSQWVSELPSEEELEKVIIPKLIEGLGHTPSMRDMGGIINNLQNTYPGIDGKLVSSIFRKFCS